MKYALVVLGLAAAVVCGALLFPRHVHDKSPLADVVADGRVIIAADRIEGYRPRTTQLLVDWAHVDPTQEASRLDEGFTLFDEGRPGDPDRRTFVFGPNDFGKPGPHPISHYAYDLDGDGHSEIMAIQSIGGSSGSRVFHLIGRSHGRTRELYQAEISYDDGVVVFDGRRMVSYKDAVRQPGDHGIHCCWIRYHKTVRELRHGDLVVTDRSRVSRLPRVDPDYSALIGGSK